MTKVGKTSGNQQHIYNSELLRLVKILCVVVILVQAVYLALSSNIDNALFSLGWGLSDSGFVIWPLAVVYVFIGLDIFFLKPKTRPQISLLLSCCILATIIFTFLMEVGGDVAWGSWLILLVLTGILLGKGPFFIAAGMFTLFGIANDLIHFFMTGEIATITTTGILLLIMFSFFIVKLRDIGVVNFDLYEKTRQREQVQTVNLSAVINSIDYAIISIDNNGTIRFCNSSALSLLDTNSALAGQNIDNVLNLVNSDNQKISLTQLAKQIKGSSRRSDLQHVFSDGERIDLLLSLSPIRSPFSKNSDTPFGTIIVANDITKQKTLDDQRDEFISIVSHELRTPAAIIEAALSNLQFMNQKGSAINNDDFTSSLAAAHDQATHLTQMVNDLSTLSRVKGDEDMDHEIINVKGFLSELYNKYLPEAKNRGLSFILDAQTDDNIDTSPVALNEILQNLIVNALKYTEKGGVTISAHNIFDVKGATYIEFTVRDTGVGISQSDQRHIFQRFWQSEDYYTRESGGTGLGLHIAEQLATQIDTKIKVESQLGQGSTFSFRLPVAETATN